MDKITAELNGLEWMMGTKKVKLGWKNGKGKGFVKGLRKDGLEWWNIIVKKTKQKTITGFLDVPTTYLITPSEDPNDDRSIWVDENDKDFTFEEVI